MVLRNGRQPLVQEKLEAEVVRPDKETMAPEVQTPVTDGVILGCQGHWGLG